MHTDTDDIPFATLKSTIAAVVDWLKSAAVRGVIIGGVANAFLGRPRNTRDVDAMVVLDDDSQLAPLLEKAAAFGIVPRIPDAVDFARVNRVLLLRHAPSRIDVDVSCGHLPFESEVLDRAIVNRRLGFDVPVPTPEDLIVMKLVAHRPHDWRDVEGLIDTHPDLDVKYVMLWVRRFADIMETPEVVEEFEKLLLIARSDATKLKFPSRSSKKQTVKLKPTPNRTGTKAVKKAIGNSKRAAAKKKSAKSPRKKARPD